MFGSMAGTETAPKLLELTWRDEDEETGEQGIISSSQLLSLSHKQVEVFPRLRLVELDADPSSRALYIPSDQQWLEGLADEARRLQKDQPGSLRLAHEILEAFFSDQQNVDLIASNHTLKKLFQLTPRSSAGFIIHKIQDTLCIDDITSQDAEPPNPFRDLLRQLAAQDKAGPLRLPSSEMEAEDLERNMDIDRDVDVEIDMEMDQRYPSSSSSSSSLASKPPLHALPWHTPEPAAAQAQGKQEMYQIQAHRLSLTHAENDVMAEPLPSLKARSSSLEYPDKHKHMWTFHDMNAVVESDLAIFGDDKHPAISLRVSEASKPINVLTGMDVWLDALMTNVPEVMMCYHVDGVFNSVERLETRDLPARFRFDAEAVSNLSRDLISFLKDSCTQEGHTYWLLKEEGDDLVRLFDLTPLLDAQQDTGPEGGEPSNPFAHSVALLLYRIASQMLRSPTDKSDKGTIRRLLTNAKSLVDQEQFPHLTAAIHYLLSGIDGDKPHPQPAPSSKKDKSQTSASASATTSASARGGAEAMPMPADLHQHLEMSLEYISEGLAFLMSRPDDPKCQLLVPAMLTRALTLIARQAAHAIEADRPAHALRACHLGLAVRTFWKNNFAGVGDPAQAREQDMGGSGTSTGTGTGRGPAGTGVVGGATFGTTAVACAGKASSKSKGKHKQNKKNKSRNSTNINTSTSISASPAPDSREPPSGTQVALPFNLGLGLVLDQDPYDELMESLGDVFVLLTQHDADRSRTMILDALSRNASEELLMATCFNLSLSEWKALWETIVTCQKNGTAFEEGNQLAPLKWHCPCLAWPLPSERRQYARTAATIYDTIIQTSSSLSSKSLLMMQRKLGNAYNVGGTQLLQELILLSDSSPNSKADNKDKSKDKAAAASTCQRIRQESLALFFKAVAQFRRVSDNVNSALVNCNIAKLMRTATFCEDTESEKTVFISSRGRKLFSEVLRFYEEALTELGSRTTEPQIWDSIQVEIAAACSTFATLLQDEGDPSLVRVESEISSLFNRAITIFAQEIKLAKSQTTSTSTTREERAIRKIVHCHHRLGVLHGMSIRRLPEADQRKALKSCQRQMSHALQMYEHGFAKSIPNCMQIRVEYAAICLSFSNASVLEEALSAMLAVRHTLPFLTCEDLEPAARYVFDALLVHFKNVIHKLLRLARGGAGTRFQLMSSVFAHVLTHTTEDALPRPWAEFVRHVQKLLEHAHVALQPLGLRKGCMV